MSVCLSVCRRGWAGSRGASYSTEGASCTRVSRTRCDRPTGLTLTDLLTHSNTSHIPLLRCRSRIQAGKQGGPDSLTACLTDSRTHTLTHSLTLTHTLIPLTYPLTYLSHTPSPTLSPFSSYPPPFIPSSLLFPSLCQVRLDDGSVISAPFDDDKTVRLAPKPGPAGKPVKRCGLCGKSAPAPAVAAPPVTID